MRPPACPFAALLLAALPAAAVAQAPQPAAPRPVTITVDAARSDGTLPPVWRFFGADEPN